jgi:hypothetical protein
MAVFDDLLKARLHTLFKAQQANSLTPDQAAMSGIE